MLTYKWHITLGLINTERRKYEKHIYELQIYYETKRGIRLTELKKWKSIKC